MDPISPSAIRYIKLGRGGMWSKTCFERGEIHFGYRTIPHEVCASGDWESVLQRLTGEGRSPGNALREIRDFYTQPNTCLWITFADGHMSWAFADGPVEASSFGDESLGGPKIRKTVDGWHRTNIRGEPLLVDNLSTVLTQVAAYRQTICTIKASDYALRRINAEDEPIIAEARQARQSVVSAAGAMIKALHWADFETLVDLIFARSGWQRISRVGGSQKDTDLVLEQPTTGERAFVQVKSKAGQSVLDDYLERFARNAAYQRLFFVCHTPTTALSIGPDPTHHIWAGDHLADAAIKAGLFDWLMEKVG